MTGLLVTESSLSQEPLLLRLPARGGTLPNHRNPIGIRNTVLSVSAHWSEVQAFPGALVERPTRLLLVEERPVTQLVEARRTSTRRDVGSWKYGEAVNDEQ